MIGAARRSLCYKGRSFPACSPSANSCGSTAREPSGEAHPPAKMSHLEQGIGLIIGVFDKYSGTEGNKFTLTKGEMKTMMENELPNFLESAKDKDALDKLMKDLDENGDSEIDFNEFIIFVAAITCMCHKFFENQPPK